MITSSIHISLCLSQTSLANPYGQSSFCFGFQLFVIMVLIKWCLMLMPLANCFDWILLWKKKKRPWIYSTQRYCRSIYPVCFVVVAFDLDLLFATRCLADVFPGIDLSNFRSAGRDIHWAVCDNWCIQSLEVLRNRARVHYWTAFHSHGRFVSGDPLNPGGRICTPSWKTNSNRWTLGWKSGTFCPSPYPWRDLGDPETCCCDKWSEQRTFLRVPPLLHSLFGGWKV